MPTSPPRLGRAEEGMDIWEIGPAASANQAGSALQRVLGLELTGRPTQPDHETALSSVELALDLAHRVPVLHDISDGGAAVALSEICIASGVGAEVTLENPFSEDPHRFLAVFEPGRVELPEDSARRLGTIGRAEERRVGKECRSRWSP